MVSKVTISLTDDLLARIDAEAAACGKSRSLIVQEASACHLAQTAEERSRQAHRVRVAAAVKAMKSISAVPALDSCTSLEILREVRGTDDAAPVGELQDCGRSEGDVYPWGESSEHFDVSDDAGP